MEVLMLFDPQNCFRILVIDDDRSTHELLRRMLLKPLPVEPESHSCSLMPVFEIDSAYQGEEGLELIEKSLQEKRPYSLAFVDVRMPPGWDGVQTVRKIWEKYSDLQVIVCTAYIDYSWEQIVSELRQIDSIVILNKPLIKIEVVQLAVALTAKWQIKQQSKLRMDNLEKLLQSQRLR
jgi:two-component system, sensor histidine kinase and response regulator